MEKTDLQIHADKMARPFIYFISLFLIVFFAINYVMLNISVPDLFQRLGSLWVALLALIFGFTRVIISIVISAVENPEDLEYMTGADLKFSLARFAEPKKDVMDSVREDTDLQSQTLKLLNMFATRISKRVLAVEVLILFTATLQWGYGDLFHCWANGHGWRICY